MGLLSGLFDSPIKFKNQDYNALKKEAQDSGHPFIDLEFPPDNKALFYSGGGLSGIDWKRPKDLVGDGQPHLFVEGASAHDLIQGEMGNCWMVAACSCMASNKDIWKVVIPDYKEQEWDEQHPEKYGGVFRFRFWRFGQWVEVVIDDQLPSRAGKLVFVHSKDKTEFWSALLEKAYAKLFGSYEALDGGELAEGLEDFTGGVTESINLVEENYNNDEAKREILFKTMKKGWEHRALMAAAIPAKSKDEMEMSTDIGLVIGHAYGITAVKRIPLAGTGWFGLFNQEKIDMIRLRNPWGGHEWKGAFSDGSPEWEKINKDDREKLGLTFEDDGEFWMTFEDFCKFFTNMSICRVVNTSFFSVQKTWDESTAEGAWAAPDRNGGCANNKDTFLKNPQFVFDVTPREDECLMQLTQKTGREAGADKKKLTIGFTIMKVEHNRDVRTHRIQEIVKNSEYKNSRSIFLRHTLPRGRYVAVLCTFEPGQVGQFLFRMYTDTSNHGKELIRDQPKKGILTSLCGCFPCLKYPVMVTQLKVIRAMGLEHQDNVGGADPYAYIVCENHKYRSEAIKDTTNPEWNFSSVIFRSRPLAKPIKVQIWNSNIIKDQFMGQAVVTATDNIMDKVIEMDLCDKKESTKKCPGKVWIKISSSPSLLAI